MGSVSAVVWRLNMNWGSQFDSMPEQKKRYIKKKWINPLAFKLSYGFYLNS